MTTLDRTLNTTLRSAMAAATGTKGETCEPAAKFDFLPQTTSVRNLLDACLACLDHLPTDLRAQLMGRMRAFESVGTPTSFSLSDMMSTIDDPDLALTDSENRLALSEYIRSFQVPDAAWDKMASFVRDVRARRVVSIRVEWGIDAGAGGAEVSYIPKALVDGCLARCESTEDAVTQAVREFTGKPTACVVHYALDELFNEFGESIED